MRNSIEFKVYGRYGLFTDPLTKLGGEKCTYQIPTYEALKGIVKSIYWKPTIIWYVDKVRIMKPIRMQTKGIKPIKFSRGKEESVYDLSIYTYLYDIEYQVQAHFEMNKFRSELEKDRNEGKHYNIALRSLDRGGRQDIFLGTRDCQAYIEPCCFGDTIGTYDNQGELGFSMMFHSFDYPDETGVNEFKSNYWCPKMINGVVDFVKPEECEFKKFLRDMKPKKFGLTENILPCKEEEVKYELAE